MTARCAGLDPEWWEPESGSARLAMQLCQACTGCPDNDPTPHGVIRQGIPYADTGRVVPICPSCGYPDVAYRGGEVGLCGRCRVPDVAIPSCRGTRTEQIASMVTDGLKDTQIAWALGLGTETIRDLRKQAGIRRRATPLPVPA